MEIIVDKEEKPSRIQELKNNPETAPTVRLVFAIIEQALLDVLDNDIAEQQSAYTWIRNNYWAFKLFGISEDVVREWIKRVVTDTKFRNSEFKRLTDELKKNEKPSEDKKWEGNVYHGNFKNIK